MLTVLHCVIINGIEISVFEEDEASFGERYLCVYNPLTPDTKETELLNENNYENIVKKNKHLLYTNDYSVAMAFFGFAVAKEAKAQRQEELAKIDSNIVTPDQCFAIDDTTDLLGKVVVLDAKDTSLTSGWQIRLVVGGSHNMLRCAKVSDGMRQNMPRHMLLGILRPECYPDWVTERLKCITEGKQKRTDFAGF